MLCFIAIYSRVLLQETQVVFSIFTYQLIRIAKPGFRNLFEKKGKVSLSRCLLAEQEYTLVISLCQQYRGFKMTGQLLSQYYSCNHLNHFVYLCQKQH